MIRKKFRRNTGIFDSEDFYIDTLWVEESIRKQGDGKKYLDAAEREAIKNERIPFTLYTWAFQAEKFYLKIGLPSFLMKV